jgi:hypothetical protein
MAPVGSKGGRADSRPTTGGRQGSGTRTMAQRQPCSASRGYSRWTRFTGRPALRDDTWRGHRCDPATRSAVPQELMVVAPVAVVVAEWSPPPVTDGRGIQSSHGNRCSRGNSGTRSRGIAGVVDRVTGVIEYAYRLSSPTGSVGRRRGGDRVGVVLPVGAGSGRVQRRGGTGSVAAGLLVDHDLPGRTVKPQTPTSPSVPSRSPVKRRSTACGTSRSRSAITPVPGPDVVVDRRRVRSWCFLGGSAGGRNALGRGLRGIVRRTGTR